MPPHCWFSQPAAIDTAVGARTMGGSTLTGAVSSNLRSVHPDLAPVHIDLRPVHSDLIAGHTDSGPVHSDSVAVRFITLLEDDADASPQEEELDGTVRRCHSRRSRCCRRIGRAPQVR